MSKNNPKYLISACLCGSPCRYDGSSRVNTDLTALYNKGMALLVCPECLGGLKIPRSPAEIINGKVISQAGKDVSNEFSKGARRVLAIAQKYGITTAILKERSPSCGSSMIYDGTFNKKLIPGKGITSRLLWAHGILVLSEENFCDVIEKN